jgi:hypothetical protein
MFVLARIQQVRVTIESFLDQRTVIHHRRTFQSSLPIDTLPVSLMIESATGEYPFAYPATCAATIIRCTYTSTIRRNRWTACAVVRDLLERCIDARTERSGGYRDRCNAGVVSDDAGYINGRTIQANGGCASFP